MRIALKIKSWFRKPKVGDLVQVGNLQYQIIVTTRYKTSFMRSISEDGDTVVSRLCATCDLKWLPYAQCWIVKQKN